MPLALCCSGSRLDGSYVCVREWVGECAYTHTCMFDNIIIPVIKLHVVLDVCSFCNTCIYVHVHVAQISCVVKLI